jgi:hypothetical protein
MTNDFFGGDLETLGDEVDDGTVLGRFASVDTRSLRLLRGGLLGLRALRGIFRVWGAFVRGGYCSIWGSGVSWRLVGLALGLALLAQGL